MYTAQRIESMRLKRKLLHPELIRASLNILNDVLPEEYLDLTRNSKRLLLKLPGRSLVAIIPYKQMSNIAGAELDRIMLSC